MTNHVLPGMAWGCAILLALAHCGCTSTKGSPGWSAAWQKKPPAQTNPNDRETVTYLGQKKQKQLPKTEEIQAQLGRAETDRSKVFAEQLRLGKQHLRDNRLDDAKRAYERALSVRSNDPDCHHGLAVIADNQKDYRTADDHYQAALKQRPRDANLLSDCGYSQYLRGNYSQAEQTLNEALAISPSHKGAMANLGAIYQRQGRQDDALAMFRRGVPEAEVPKYMSQLFPQSRPGSGFEDVSLAQNNGSGSGRTAPPMPADDKRDYSASAPNLAGMPPEQLKELMRIKRAEGQRQRNDQMMAEIQPPRRESDDWAQNRQQFATGANASNQNWAAGQSWAGGGNAIQLPANLTPSNQMPVVTPSGAEMAQGNSRYASNQHPANQAYSPNQGANMSAFPQASNGALMAPSGTNPEVAVWEGARVQNPGYQQNSSVVQSSAQMPGNSQSLANGQIPGNSQLPPGAANGWFQQQQSGNEMAGNAPNSRFAPGLNPGLGSDPNSQTITQTSASAAAAQLGMNAGPGGLFPVVNSDYTTSNGGSWNGGRLSHEFPSTPQYQNVPPTGSFGRDSSQINQNTMPIAPPSPSTNWGHFRSSSSNPSAGSTIPSGDGNPSAASSGASYRGSNSNWGDSVVPAGGAIPFDGSWPAGANTNGGQTQPTNTFGSNSNPNYPPLWNRGGSSSPPPKVFGTNAPASTGNIPEQWPYGPGQ